MLVSVYAKEIETVFFPLAFGCRRVFSCFFAGSFTLKINLFEKSCAEV